MQKTKFQIKNMHCKSCASLIEGKLKKLEGVIEAKVNFDSKKAVVVYDENKINEDEIKKAIEKGGDYQVESDSEIMGKENFQNKKPSQFNDLSIPISIIIAGLMIAGAIIVTNRNSKPSLKEIGQQQAQNLPDTNSQSQPTAPSVEFKITKDDHVRGDFNAPITLVEFSDFECPFCERHYPTMNKILNDYKGKVRLFINTFLWDFILMPGKRPRPQNVRENKENFGSIMTGYLRINPAV